MFRCVFLGFICALSAGCIDTEQDYVAVVGVGEAKAFPTSARLSLVLQGLGDTSEKANESLALKVEKMRSIAAEYDLTDSDIDSLYFSVDRETKMLRTPDGTRETVPGDFIAEQHFAISTSDVHNAGQLLGALITAGPENVYPPVYTIEDTKDLFEKARSLAIEDAATRAEQYVDKLGKQLGSVEIIEESGIESQRLEYNLRDRVVRTYSQQETGAEQIMPMLMADSPRGSRVFAKPEEISVTVSVYVKFALSDL